MTTVRELMTETPITLGVDHEIGLARDTILESGVHCLPVVDDDGGPVGIVSSWDLVEEYAPLESVRNAMTQRVLTIGPDEDAAAAAAVMQSNVVHHLVVVDHTGTVIGVISSLDLLSAVTDD